MSNDLRLYHSAASPNSRRVRIFLAEKGIAIPVCTENPVRVDDAMESSKLTK